MAYNRKLRKFEGTCYIPGEQLAMMAKYYRGANLNLNLTLFEDDLATMQETLDQACWCSKLDELDRMKMAHMKGNEWRLAHEHCLDRQGPNAMNPQSHPALPQKSKSTVGKVERGTSAVSLYDRERGLVRGGRYQRDDYPGACNRRDDYYERFNRRYEYNEQRNRRGYYSDPRSPRDDYDMQYRKGDYPGPPAYHAQVERAGRKMGGPSDQGNDMESEVPASSMPEAPGEIRCAVCNMETCLVCKNHVNSPICQCKCPVANAGLCNKCNPEPCDDDEQVTQESVGNKMDFSSMMFTMMMSSMFKQNQAPGTICCCKPSRDNSDSSSSDSSDGKVHKVYLYDCEDIKKSKKSKSKANSEISSACDCCKCSRKPKRTSGKKDGETSESEAAQKPKITKGKGSKDTKTNSRGGDTSSETDVKPSRESPVKSTHMDRPSKSSKQDDRKSIKSDNMKPTKMGDQHFSSLQSSKVKTGEKGQVSIDSRNSLFPKNREMSSTPNQDEAERPPSPPKFSSKQKFDAQMPGTSNVPDWEGSTGSIREESSTTFNLREFIVCLPKIQSHLQSLMHKLNQMGHLNNQMQFPQMDPVSTNSQSHPEGSPPHQNIPLISPPVNVSEALHSNHLQQCNSTQKHEPEIGRDLMPGNIPVGSLPPTISPRESNLQARLNSPTRYQPPNFHRPGQNLIETGDRTRVIQAPELAESPNQTQTNFRFSPLIGSHEQNSVGKYRNEWSVKEGNHIVHHPPSMTSPNINKSAQPSYSKSSYHNVEIVELPDTNAFNQHNNRSREKAKPGRSATTSSRFGRETFFQSYNRESSGDTSEQFPTEYASFDEATRQPPGTPPKQQTAYQRKNQNVIKSKTKSPPKLDHQGSVLSKCSQSNRTERAKDKTLSKLKTPKGVAFKAKQRNKLSLEKLVQGCSIRHAKGTRGVTYEKARADGKPVVKVQDQAVGPGKFRRSKSDSSLDYSNRDISKKHSPPVRPKTPKVPKGTSKPRTATLVPAVPLKKKRSKSPVKEKAKYTMATKQPCEPPETMESQTHGRTSVKNMPTYFIEDPSDSIMKISDAYVRQEVDTGSQSYIVSSVEIKTVNDGSATDILKMIQGIASHSVMNMTTSSVPRQSAPLSSEELNGIPLLPALSTGPGDGSDSNSDKNSGVVGEKRVTFDNEHSPNTPAFLRKSRVQVEQLKRAHETIRSMIRNVNDVIAHIDSDSKIGIKAKARTDDRDRQSYFVHLGDDERRPGQSTRATTFERFERKFEPGTSFSPTSRDIQNQEVQQMFLSVDRVLNSVLTPSDQSSVTPEDHCPLEFSPPTRAHRDYYILDSESSSTAFTESLRRSLENETSRSVPLAAQRLAMPQLSPSERPRSTRPLKRRSWFPPPKK